MFGLGWHDTRCGSKPLWENLFGNMFRVLFQTQKTQSSEKNCLYVHFSQLVLKLSREFGGHHTLKKEIPQTTIHLHCSIPSNGPGNCRE